MADFAGNWFASDRPIFPYNSAAFSFFFVAFTIDILCIHAQQYEGCGHDGPHPYLKVVYPLAL